MLKIIETPPKDLGQSLSLGALDAELYDDVIQNGTVYCIKHCLHPESIDRVRAMVCDYYQTIPQTNISYDALTSTQNYHSIESGISPRQKTFHYFHGYVFNRIEELAPDIGPHIHGLFHSLASFYNSLTGQNRSLIGAHADGKQFRPQIFQYPLGGGMFAAHSHPLEPQKIGIILGFSKQGRDYNEGGAGFEAPDGSIIDTGPIQDIGDIVLFRYDLKHWVSPCDIKSALQDNDRNGRWSAVIPIY